MKSILASLLFLFIWPLWALAPEAMCSDEILENLKESSAYHYSKFSRICEYAGQYSDSLLPDEPLKKNTNSRTNIYFYDEFFEGLERATGKVTSRDICGPGATMSSDVVAYPTTMVEKTASGAIPLSVVDENVLQEIFKEIQNDPKYGFDFVEDGCWARAHLIGLELEKRGIRIGKVFAEGSLTVKTPKALNGESVTWSYHVAPMIAVQTAKGVEMRVIDPAVFDRPVSTKEWADAMLNEQSKEDVIIYNTDRFVMSPLRGQSTRVLQEDPSKGRWHQAEVAWAEEELREFRDLKAEMNRYLEEQKAARGGRQ